jgi:gas vesicle protein
MNTKIEDLTSRYELIIEKEIERSKQTYRELRKQLIKCSGEDLTETRMGLEFQIEMATEDHNKIKAELDLVSAGQGLIRSVISKYKSGFKRGYNNYLETETFARSTALFN